MTALAPVAPAAPGRVPMGRLIGGSAGLLTAETGGLLAAGRSPEELLYAVCATVMVVFAVVFCLRAVTVAGFVAGIGAAGLVVVEPGWLPAVLLGAVGLAVVCGLAPGWSRVEAWQAQHSVALTAAQEATAGPVTAPAPAAGVRGTARRVRGNWRSDRVLAALLVLVYPPLAASGAVWFVAWTASR